MSGRRWTRQGDLGRKPHECSTVSKCIQVHPGVPALGLCNFRNSSPTGRIWPVEQIDSAGQDTVAPSGTEGLIYDATGGGLVSRTDDSRSCVGYSAAGACGRGR